MFLEKISDKIHGIQATKKNSAVEKFARLKNYAIKFRIKNNRDQELINP